MNRLFLFPILALLASACGGEGPVERSRAVGTERPTPFVISGPVGETTLTDPHPGTRTPELDHPVDRVDSDDDDDFLEAICEFRGIDPCIDCVCSNLHDPEVCVSQCI